MRIGASDNKGDGLASQPRPGGGGVEKIHANFFRTPPPPGVPPGKKKLAPHVGIFFAKRNFFTVCYLNLHVTFTLAHCMTLAHELLLG